MFVAIEGTDAAGKATQSQLLADRIEKTGNPVFRYSFPRYQTPLGEAILKHLKNEISVKKTITIHSYDSISIESADADEDALIFQCMMLADKYDAARDITLQLRDGATVVSDRWWQSGWVYGKADGLEERWLSSVFRCLPQADLNIFIDVPPDEALRRRPEARDRYEKDRAKQEVVRKNYQYLWSSAAKEIYSDRSSYLVTPREAWMRIDGVRSVDEVHEEIWKRVVEMIAIFHNRQHLIVGGK